MNQNKLNAMFRERYPDYEVIVLPPCISPNRETEYIMKARAIALGLRDNDGSVTINHEHKKVFYRR